MTKYQKNVAMLFLAGSWVTLVITRLFFFVSEELTTRNNALHFSYILKIVKILQDCLIQFAIGPAVNTLGAFLMKVGARSHSLDYYNQYAVSFYVSINKLNSSGNFCNGTTFPIMLGIIWSQDCEILCFDLLVTTTTKRCCVMSDFNSIKKTWSQWLLTPVFKFHSVMSSTKY